MHYKNEFYIRKNSIAGGLFNLPGENKTPCVDSYEFSRQVCSQQKVSYTVTICRDLLSPLNPTLATTCGIQNASSKKRLVVIDNTVFDLYKHQLTAYFSAWGISPAWKIISGNEVAKTLEQTISVVDAMIEEGLLRRAEAIIAIGGGVLLDIVGFAASLYRRGIPYVRIPTTLMGQIDAGIGIKTGINYDYHKNRLGSYFPPLSTLIDPSFLRTLDQRHIANGIGEIIKMALIKDKELFCLLEDTINRLNAETIANYSPDIHDMFCRAINGMLDELQPNLWEMTLERAVDYGHTFSPLLELHANPPLLHGEAVAIDMALSLAIALQRKLLTPIETERALNLIVQAGLPISHPHFSLELIEKALLDSVKHRDGLQRLPLTAGLGSAIFANDLTMLEIQAAYQYLQRFAARLCQIRKVA